MTPLHTDIERYVRRATWALWGEHRAVTRLELRAHLAQRAMNYEAQGQSPDQAAQSAIRDLGDADRVHLGLWWAHVGMLASDTLGVAFAPFRTRTLESLLITLAVALGVGVTTAMLALLGAGQKEQARWAGSADARALEVRSADQDWGGLYTPSGPLAAVKVAPRGAKPLTLGAADLRAARSAVPAAQHVYFASSGGPLVGPGLTVTAFAGDYLEVRGLKLVAGNWFSDAERATGEKVIVLSRKASQKLLGDKAATGQTVEVGGQPYRVIGVFEAAPGQELDADEGGIVPWRAGAGFTVQALTVVARPGELGAAEAQVRAFAARQYGERATVSSQAEQVRSAVRQLSRSRLVMVLFACGGLLIAAINITNLMLFRVLSRTRGIGVAGALGAGRAAIFRMFLAESVALGLVGGLVGIGVAQGLMAALGGLVRSSGMMSRVLPELSMTPGLLLTGVAVAVAVSVVFGAYPAAVAARIRPVEALRA